MESENAPYVVLREWDARLQALWDTRLSVGLEAAHSLFAPDAEEEQSLPGAEDYLVAQFWRLLTSGWPQCPKRASERYFAVLVVVWKVLEAILQSPTEPFVEDYLAVALRPVRRLQAGRLTPLVCEALYDFHRGLWALHLTKPQMWTIRTALAKTLAALPPDEMSVFWEKMVSDDPMMREAMRLGLEFLRSAHALPHLLHGLETSRDHATRAAIVDCLEQIADPRAIATLTRLRRETAHDDWTLSRHISRAIRVIEQQNRGQNHRVLLRPAATPLDAEATLLRPATDANRSDTDSATLLRPPQDTEHDSS